MYTLNDLHTVMQRLRSPQGCPWDRQQTFASLVPHTLEEAYEVIDTIEQQQWSHLKDELGDLLFQIVFYAEIAKEEELFELQDVIHNLVEKLIRRHPHVFTTGELSDETTATPLSSEAVKQRWEDIKRAERVEKAHSGILADIPRALPALNRAAKLQKRAAHVGFDWPEAIQVLDKIEEEIAELRHAIAQGNLSDMLDESGDLLFAQVNLCRHLGIDSEQALRSTNHKFERRFTYVEEQVILKHQGDFSQCTLEQLDQYWNDAKMLEKKTPILQTTSSRSR